MPEQEESITNESIIAYQRDLDILNSNRQELIKTISAWSAKKEQIQRINQKMEIRLNHPEPFKPPTFSLNGQEDQGWNSYFVTCKEYLRGKQEKEELKEQLNGLEQELKEIEGKIRPLVPPNFYGTQLVNGIQHCRVYSDKITE